MNKRVTAIGLTAGLLAGAGAGLILEMSGNAGASSNAAVVTAATDETTSTASDTGSDSGATDAGTDPSADHAARLQEILQPLVDDGTLTQDQLDKVIAALDAAGPMGGGPGMGGDHDGDGGRGGFAGGGLSTVADVLGLTEDEVRTAIEGGQTIADLATANGTTAQAVIDALVAQLEAHFADEVASGEHTQEEADAMIADATTRITDFVNNTQTAGPGGMGGGPGGMGGHGRGPGDHDGDGGSGSGSTGTGGSIDGGPSDTPTSVDA